MSSIYKNIQLSGEELEKLELENKTLETQAEEQVISLHVGRGPVYSFRIPQIGCQYTDNTKSPYSLPRLVYHTHTHTHTNVTGAEAPDCGGT